MPSELLRRRSGSRAGCWLPGSELTPQPRAGIAGETGRRRQRCATACGRPLRPEDTVQVQVARGRSFAAPPALCRAEGARGGRRAEGVSAGGRQAGSPGGRREEGGGSARGSAPSPWPLRVFH